APLARLEGRDRFRRPHRGRPRLGFLRLGRRRVEELRLGSRRARDPARSRPHGQAAGGHAPRPLRVLGPGRNMEKKSIKVGVIADLTGTLSPMGVANANVMTMLVDDLNASGGLLGQRVELIVEDGETVDAVAKAKAAKLVDEDKVDVVIGGIYSST